MTSTVTITLCVPETKNFPYLLITEKNICFFPHQEGIWRGQRYSITHSALFAGEWSTSHPGRFTPWNKQQYPFNRRLGRPQTLARRFGEENPLLPMPGFEYRIVQPFAQSLNGLLKIFNFLKII
jgi:hypothetical protein